MNTHNFKGIRKQVLKTYINLFPRISLQSYDLES